MAVVVVLVFGAGVVLEYFLASCPAIVAVRTVITLAETSHSRSPDGVTYWTNLTARTPMPTPDGECPVGPGPSIVLNGFGLSLVNASSTMPYPPSTALCQNVSDLGECTAQGAGVRWYAVLSNTSGSYLASYPTSATSQVWTNGTAILYGTVDLTLISPTQLADSDAQLSVFGENGQPWTGTLAL